MNLDRPVRYAHRDWRDMDTRCPLTIAYIRRAAPTAFLLLALLAAAPCPAQSEFSEQEIPTDPTEPALKRWHLLRRPGKRTPQDQLEHAQALENADRTKAALRQFDSLVRTWPDSREAADAQYAVARLYEQLGALDKAFEEYQYLIRNYSNLFPYTAVLERQYEIAKTVIYRRRRFLFIPHKTPEDALPMLEQIVANGPRWKHAGDAQFTMGTIYEEQEDYDMAIVSYMTVQYRYPDASFSAEAAFRHARCLHHVAERSPNDEAARQEALSFLARYLQRHAGSEHARAAQNLYEQLHKKQVATAFDRAAYYDRIARRPRAALIAYEDFVRQYPTGKPADAARARIAQLRPPSDDTRKDPSEPTPD